MANIFISSPGTEYGPCSELCGHSDCEVSRMQADSICVECGKLIGYERRFGEAPHKPGLMHVACWRDDMMPAEASR